MFLHFSSQALRMDKTMAKLNCSSNAKKFPLICKGSQTRALELLVFPEILDKNKEEKGSPLFSFEYFPPKTDKGVENLYDRLDRMSTLGPSWVDVTWGAGGSTSDLTLEICHTSQNLVGLETMMHLTCTNMPVEGVRKALDQAKESRIQNILALRGDPPRGEEWKQIEGGFGYAADLIRFIRKEYGNYFGIAVAGYPEGHIDAESYEADLINLKAKVDAGADVIITQLFYDVDLFLKYVQDVRNLGITIPIIPGIMPIHTYAGFSRMTSLCKTIIPQAITDALEPIKNDDEAVKEYGVQYGIEMCKRLLEAGMPALHFYTLNLEKSCVQILEGLGLLDSEVRRPLPWTPLPKRKEDVRPIFWALRPKSYIHRTASWDDFPNGRWGDSRSPAYGDLTDYHLSALHAVKSVDRRKEWGEEVKDEKDIFAVFAAYCNGSVSILPWCNTPLAQESQLIKDQLINLNNHGFLTINSQPRINGASSSDEKVGWGPKGGYIYQKAYLEFFTSPENLKLFMETSQKFPNVTYHAINFKGDISHTNAPEGSQASAVTWGVFPGREILQPTVVDHDSFIVWKDEAFALWKSQWTCLYEEGSKSRAILDKITDSYFLVNVVDNNFIDGDIFAIFNSFFNRTPSQ